MIFEKKCFISPKDILAVRLRCAECKATQTIPLDKLTGQNIQTVIAQSCPHCNTPSKLSYDTVEFRKLIQFGGLLSELGNLLEGRNLEYGFEIECPDNKPKDAN
jgi:hypothetical protein